MGIEKIKEMIESAEAKIKGDPDMMEKFKADPVKTLEGILGVDLPDEQVKAVAEMLKKKLEGGAEGAGDMIHNLMGTLGGLFHKDS